MFALASSALAADVTFSDVPSDHWAYETILKATNEYGLFQGMGTDENGNPYFSPGTSMTIAQFITVCVRAAGYEATAAPEGSPWYQGYYNQAVELQIVDPDDFGGIANYNNPMTREQMTKAIVGIMNFRGEKAEKLVPYENIPDMNSVDVEYRQVVDKAYSMGILCGVDDEGTFSPKTTLTRAQAATVCVRLLDKDSRVPVSFEKKEQKVAAGEWIEGQPHAPAKAGDVVIKADGTRVVLEETVLSKPGAPMRLAVLGLGQGVDYWSGTQYGQRIIQIGDSAQFVMNDGDGSRIVKHGDMVYTETEWKSIMLLPEYKSPGAEYGRYYGEVRNHIWVWTEGGIDADGDLLPDYWGLLH